MWKLVEIGSNQNLKTPFFKISVLHTKGQLISKGPFGFIVSSKIPDLASKKRLNQKIIEALYLFLII